MRTIAFKTLFAAGAIAFGLGGVTPSSAETTFTVSSWLPPKHPIVANMIVPWAEQVEAATGGNVKIKILAKPLGKPPAHFDLARQGQADITYGVHGYQPGRFLLTRAAEFAFLGDKAEDVSVAYWRIHEKHFAGADEHNGVKVLGIFTHGPGQMFNAKHAINSVADLNGLKIRVGGGAINQITTGMGATALLKSATKAYELMSHGVADGTFFPKESIKSFKLTKLVRHGTLVPGGLYNTSFFLVMNLDKFNGLSAADQAAMMKVSGENFSRISGKAWDAADDAGVAAMKADGVE
ncbi:MAG: TRAP transporter substrate-binding protein, partial [Rhodospirillales bacterium]|nr:TRAP transporter substrate-binding protein [Rhodospirillales bacterium]